MDMEPVRRTGGSSAGKVAPQCRRRAVRGSRVAAPAPWGPSRDAALCLDHHPPVSNRSRRELPGLGLSDPCVLQAQEGDLPCTLLCVLSGLLPFLLCTPP